MSKKEAKRKKEIKRNSFLDMFDVFHENIKLHKVSMEILGGYATKYDNKALDEFHKRIKQTSKAGEKPDERIIDGESLHNAVMSLRRKKPEQSSLFKKNVIVSMVSTIEILFGRIYENYILNSPHELTEETDHLHFKELDNFTTIKEAKQFIVERKVEKFLLLSGSKNRLDIISTKLDIETEPINKFLSEFSKLVKIRNLIVHNLGHADKKFISLYGYKKTKVGDEINITDAYAQKSLNLLFFLGSYILQEAQIKSREKIGEYEYIINNTLHDLVQCEDYTYSKTIYDYVKCHELVNSQKMMVTINYCIGLKKQGKSQKKINQVLDSSDWSGVSDEFKMARYGLQDEDQFYIILEKILKENLLSKDNIENWEIFSLYKRKKKFINLVQKYKTRN